MALKDGEEGDIYTWMVNEDTVFREFMTAKDHFEGQLNPWEKRLTQDQKIAAARQYKFQQRWWPSLKKAKGLT